MEKFELGAARFIAGLRRTVDGVQGRCRGWPGMSVRSRRGRRCGGGGRLVGGGRGERRASAPSVVGHGARRALARAGHASGGSGLPRGCPTAAEGSGGVVGCGIRLTRRRGGLPHRSGSAAWPQGPCSLARVAITTAPWIDPA